MTKKLKIKFWKAERALVMQILEQEGLPEEKLDGIVRIVTVPAMINKNIYLRGNAPFRYFDICYSYFETNQERDVYLDKAIKAITDELFTTNGKLKVGETCEIRDYAHEAWEPRTLLAILPDKFKKRFIVKMKGYDDDWISYHQARPILKHTEPKVEINGEIEIYTWEEE